MRWGRLAAKNAWLRSLQESLLGLAFPAACTSCGQEFATQTPSILLCTACLEQLSQGYDNACPRCAQPTSVVGGAKVCGECHKRQYRFSAAIAVGKYETLLRTLILRAKSGRDDALTIALGQLAAQRWLLQPVPPSLDGIVAVPMAGLRRITRPANAAEVLSEAVAQQLRVPVLSGVLRFRRNIRRQTDLNRAQRARNVRGAMAASTTYDITGANLLLVDDVFTTGATADEATRALLTAGAATVSVLVIARGAGLE